MSFAGLCMLKTIDQSDVIVESMLSKIRMLTKQHHEEIILGLWLRTTERHH